MQKINQDRIKPQKFQDEDKSTRASGLKEFNCYKNHSAFRGKFKARHKVCSLRRRRASRLDELVQVDSISNPSGSSNESFHEGLVVVPFRIGNLDRRQLLFSSFLAVDTNQLQSHISTASGKRILPFLHSTRDLIESSHQRLEVISKRCPWPECCVDARHRDLQTSKVIDNTSDTGFQSEHVHGSFVLHRREDGVQACLNSPSLFLEVLAEFCTHNTMVTQ